MKPGRLAFVRRLHSFKRFSFCRKRGRVDPRSSHSASVIERKTIWYPDQNNKDVMYNRNKRTPQVILVIYPRRATLYDRISGSSSSISCIARFGRLDRSRAGSSGWKANC